MKKDNRPNLAERHLMALHKINLHLAKIAAMYTEDIQGDSYIAEEIKNARTHVTEARNLIAELFVIRHEFLERTK